MINTFQKSEKITYNFILCISCCKNIHNLYNFRNTCVKNQRIFEGYVIQLSKYDNEKDSKLFVDLHKNNLIPKKNLNKMTYNEELTYSNSENFYFAMSTDDYQIENCTPVSASQMNYLECSQNIQDLSQSTSVSNLNFYDNTQNFDNNTDGEITNMIESFCGK